jgi:hypothetical protein
MDWEGFYTGNHSDNLKATLSCMALELVHKYKLEKEMEMEYAKILFVCLVVAICLGAPAAETWVSKFGKLNPQTPISLPSEIIGDIEENASLLTEKETL